VFLLVGFQHDLEYDAAAADCSTGGIGRVATEVRRAIEIAQVVAYHAAEGRKPIFTSGEVVENGLFPAGVDFENGSVTKIGADDCIAPLPVMS